MVASQQDSDQQPVSASQFAILLLSIFVVALCGIAYELIIGTVSSYLLGNSVYQFSLTIGLFMFAMGVGAYISKLFIRNLISSFIAIETAISLVGGLCSLILFLVFPFYAFYKPAMFGLIVVIGALVGLEIPILTRILTRKQALRFSIAQVLSLDYVGALIGSLAFPLVLLPHLGLFRSSFAIGLLNISVALMNVWVFRKALRRPIWTSAACALIAALLIVCTGLAQAIAHMAENRLFADEVLYRNHTPYQRIVLTRSARTGAMRLYLDGHIQFWERDEYRYHEALVHPAMSVPGQRRRVLILGGGDGLAAREVLKYPDVDRIDLVDIDPAITRLCSHFPPLQRLNNDSLRNPKVSIHHMDAFIYVQRHKEKFDRVFIDLPDPHNEGLSKLYSVEFYRGLAKRMEEDGVMATQSSSPFFTREVFWAIARTLQAAGFSTHSYQIPVPSFCLWGFTVAAPRGKIPDRFEIGVPTRFLTAEVMAGAAVFGHDTGPVDGPVNSIFEPKLYRLYLKGIVQ
jgi:spermidine synthase